MHHLKKRFKKYVPCSERTIKFNGVSSWMESCTLVGERRFLAAVTYSSPFLILYRFNHSETHHGMVALVTGSSDSGGIGIAIARSLARRGCSLILTGSRQPEHVNKLKTELEIQYGIPTHYISADLSDLTSTKKLYEDVKCIYSDGVDILVNNAGITVALNPIEEIPIDVFEKCLRVNLTAGFYLTQLTLANMKQKAWGRVINISSIFGLTGYTTCAAYTAIRHAMNGLTKVVALETLGSGVTCNAICPALVNTTLAKNMTREISIKTGKPKEEIDKQLFKGLNPSGKYIETDQIGELAAFLCSPAADQITGTAIPIDAGFGAQ
ncbi:D-beta-hydroxybutyrate dehydrogenase-like [Glandiceps talaboti]